MVDPIKPNPFPKTPLVTAEDFLCEMAAEAHADLILQGWHVTPDGRLIVAKSKPSPPGGLGDWVKKKYG